MFLGGMKYDYRFMSADKVGRHGFKKNELDKLAKNLKLINSNLKNKAKDPHLSFRRLPYDKAALKNVLKLSRRLRRQFDTMVVVGIGGSDLGARAIYQALAGDYANYCQSGSHMRIFFSGNTTDPRPLVDLLKILNLKKTVFYVISKSGGTIEPLSTFLFLRKKMIWRIGPKRHKAHFIITTDDSDSQLFQLAQKEEYQILPHHQCGGRFSALTVNGLLPACCAGFDIERLLAGAKAMDRLAKKNKIKANLPYLFACLQYLAYAKRKQNISVLMPYNYSLKEFSFWFRQLWGESLAKEFDLKNKKINSGITPIAALGPVDQHSQLQLYIEGPFDKIITFIRVNDTLLNLKVPGYKDFSLSYLSGHKFKDILNMELQATSVSLMKNKRPNGTIIVPQLNEYYLGQLFYFFEMATVYLGELFNINVFDQPGVEQGKKYMYGLLGKEGYEKDKNEISQII